MRRGHLRRVALGCAVCLLAGLLTGCQKQAEPEKPAEEVCIPFEPATEIVEGRPDVYVVLKVMNSQYWQDIITGVTDAGADHGCNIYIGGVKSEADWEAQGDLLLEARERGADAVLFAPANSSTFAEVTGQLHEDGIPIVLVDTMLTLGYYDVCYMTDNFQAGELAAEALLEMLEEKGFSRTQTLQAAVQTTTKNSQTVVDRIAGFNKYWVQHAPADWTIIDEIKFNGGDSDIAVQNGRDFLEQYPDLRVMVACNNSSAVGFAQAMQDEGRTDVVLSAFDYSDIVAGMIADPSWTAATVVQQQYNMGYLGVEAAIDLTEGKPVTYKFVDTGVRVINEGNYQDYENGT